ncbi:RraA family protein [Candidimonas sp. SYP-B2681]|uniref:RraA family protein n=1 Tax=Candidimonas sp. SYP-B2681 TaxID=2497686 RepID=UPI000F86FF32|nr:RraA family protein [Candidimonas sp. SYP-B2681]RTZ41479.1 RraA family protein [Candidimonas sp. SYP-B2681]
MYLIHTLPDSIPASDLALLQRAEPATVGHFRTIGFMDAGIKAHARDLRIAGTAVTVRMPGTDGGILHYAMGCVRPGDILVIDRCGEAVTAAFGGAMAYAARQAGVAGLVVDGLVTDLGELREHGVPVWSRGPSIVTTRVLGLDGEFCGPISCGGVAVHPGDAVLADENGILVLPREHLRAAAEQAIAFQEQEKHTLARLRAGEKFPDIVGSRAVIERNIAARTA